ncbi:MAG: SCP2 sterol-binding domain-containing protein [Solirubrobacteraceae bacterium]
MADLSRSPTSSGAASPFASADEACEVIGGLFTALAADREQAGRLARTDVTAQFRLTDPDALITVQLRDRPGDPVACGPTGIEPDVVLAMPAVVLHRLLLGTVNATVAMARGQIRTEGPVAKVLALIPTLRLVGPAYRERLEAAGRTDLLESG